MMRMGEFVISCCSTADLTEEHFKTRKISYICFHYELDGKEYADDLGKSLPFDQFYQAMMNGAQTKTSQVNAEEFDGIFEGIPEGGKRYPACMPVIRHLWRNQFGRDCKGRPGGAVSGQEDLYSGLTGSICGIWAFDGSAGRSA